MPIVGEVKWVARNHSHPGGKLVGEPGEPCHVSTCQKEV